MNSSIRSRQTSAEIQVSPRPSQARSVPPPGGATDHSSGPMSALQHRPFSHGPARKASFTLLNPHYQRTPSSVLNAHLRATHPLTFSNWNEIDLLLLLSTAGLTFLSRLSLPWIFFFFVLKAKTNKAVRKHRKESRLLRAGKLQSVALTSANRVSMGITKSTAWIQK